MKHALKWISLVIVVVTVFSTAGVYAAWTYAGESVEPVGESVDVIIFPWSYDSGEANDHQWLIDAIINGETADGVKVGLNGGEAIHNQIDAYENRDKVYLGSMGTLAANQLESLYKAQSGDVSWILYFPNGSSETITDENGNTVGNTMYLFTTSEELPTSFWGTGGYIYPVYRVTVTYNVESGLWQEQKLEVGSAKTAIYEELISGGLGGIIMSNYAWDPKTWVEGDQT